MLVDISPETRDDCWISVIVHEYSDDRLVFCKFAQVGMSRHFVGLVVERVENGFRTMDKGATLRVRKTRIEKLRKERGLT